MMCRGFLLNFFFLHRLINDVLPAAVVSSPRAGDDLDAVKQRHMLARDMSSTLRRSSVEQVETIVRKWFPSPKKSYQGRRMHPPPSIHSISLFLLIFEDGLKNKSIPILPLGTPSRATSLSSRAAAPWYPSRGIDSMVSVPFFFLQGTLNA